MGRNSRISSIDIKTDTEKTDIETVNMRSLYPGKIIVQCGVDKYVFPEAGSVVKVNKECLDKFERMVSRGGCCGGTTESKLFELIQ